MTGTILALLPSICVGKARYLMKINDFVKKNLDFGASKTIFLSIWTIFLQLERLVPRRCGEDIAEGNEKKLPQRHCRGQRNLLHVHGDEGHDAREEAVENDQEDGMLKQTLLWLILTFRRGVDIIRNRHDFFLQVTVSPKREDNSQRAESKASLKSVILRVLILRLCRVLEILFCARLQLGIGRGQLRVLAQQLVGNLAQDRRIDLDAARFSVGIGDA
jgi:hypothetical protein